jgi:hypothetical protein
MTTWMHGDEAGLSPNDINVMIIKNTVLASAFVWVPWVAFAQAFVCLRN